MCMIGDSEPWAFFSDVTRRARKEHRCTECRRTIEKGEQYRYSSGKVEGWDTIQTFRQCLQCLQVTRWLMEACNGYLFDAVQEDLAEHVVGEEMYLRGAPLTRLLRWMRAEWRRRDGTLRSLDEVKSVTDAAYREQMAKVA